MVLAVRRALLSLALACAGLLMLGTPAQAATSDPVPTFSCAAANGDGTFTYFFGYSLSGTASVTVPIGNNNQFSSSNNLSTNYATASKEDRGQPTTFLPGTYADAFSVTTADTTLIWHLTVGKARADSTALCANVPVVAEAPTALVLPLATAAPFAIWFVTMRRRHRRTLA